MIYQIKPLVWVNTVVGGKTTRSTAMTIFGEVHVVLRSSGYEAYMPGNLGPEVGHFCAHKTIEDGKAYITMWYREKLETALTNVTTSLKERLVAALNG